MKVSNVFLAVCFLIFAVHSNALAAEGCTKGNCYNGYGTYEWSSGNQYSGTFKNGSRDGEGIFTFANGERYIGQFKDGKRWGMGVFYFNDGYKYEGEYVNDERNGFGIFTLPNGARYEGEYKDGYKHGQGKFIYPDGKVVNGYWKWNAFVEPISPVNHGDDLLTATYSLTVNPLPADAKIRFLESDLDYRPGIKLTPGRYKIELSHPRYVTKVEYVDILENDMIVPVVMVLASRPADSNSREDWGIRGKNNGPGNNPKKNLTRGIKLAQNEEATGSSAGEGGPVGDEMKLQKVDRQKINSAELENELGQKMSMIEQLQQEIEMLKASFSNPKLVSIKSLPGSNTEYNRVALVIGNSQYPILGELRNPEHDAKDVAAALRELNFNVTVKLNVDQQEMETAIAEFGQRIKEDSVSLFYFAGHGVQIDGGNYLIPVESGIKSAKDIRYKSVNLNMLIDEMVYAENGKNIIILDACRNNPLSGGTGRHAILSGLARTDAPAGTLIAYATGPGSVAMDGEGRNGIYTKYLLEHIYAPGVPIELVFKRVLQGVAADTNRKQIPWMSSSLDIDFYFAKK